MDGDHKSELAGASRKSGPRSGKGILRKPKEDVAAREKRSLGGIRWDEPTIAEHDAERGTRMKIDEAPTPYERGTGLEDGNEDASIGAAIGGSGSGVAMADEWAALYSSMGGMMGTGDDTGEDDWDDDDDDAAMSPAVPPSAPQPMGSGGGGTRSASSADGGARVGVAFSAVDQHPMQASSGAGSGEESKTAAATAGDGEGKTGFKSWRKAHYADEVSKMKELMKRGAAGMDPFDEDDEDEDGDESGSGQVAMGGGGGQ